MKVKLCLIVNTLQLKTGTFKPYNVNISRALENIWNLMIKIDKKKF